MKQSGKTRITIMRRVVREDIRKVGIATFPPQSRSTLRRAVRQGMIMTPVRGFSSTRPKSGQLLEQYWR